MVFQGAMNAFDPVKRIGDQIVEPMELHGTRDGQARRRPASASCSRRVGIPPERARSYPHELSGGMRQRAAIAMALACNAARPARGRADDRARRDGAGADPRAPHVPLGRARARARVRHARPADRRPDVHARGGHVRGQDRRAGADRGALPRDAAPYTRLLWAATPDLDAHDDVVSIPGVPPRLDAELARLPVRAALRLGPRRAARRSGPSCERWATAT